MLRRFLNDEQGTNIIEYALLGAFIAAVAVAVLVADPLGVSSAIQGVISKLKTALTSI